MLQKQWPQTRSALGSTPDFYLVHSVTPESPALSDPALLARLRAVADEGTQVGLTTSGPHQAHTINIAFALPSSPFSAVQTTWNILERSAQRSLAAAAGGLDRHQGAATLTKGLLGNPLQLDVQGQLQVIALGCQGIAQSGTV